MENKKYPLLSITFFRLFIPLAFCYFMSPLLGSANAIMAPTLIKDLNLTPSNLGFMSSIYLVAFGVTQFPIGVMLDKYGAKWTLPVSLLFAVAGTFLYSQASTFPMFAISRGLSGIGLAGCLMCGYKAYSYWIMTDRLPIAYSCQALMGGIGGMFATKPLSIAFEMVGWRYSFIGLTAILALIILMIVVIVPRDKVSKSADTDCAELFNGMVRLLKKRRFWNVAMIISVIESVYFVFQYLWIGPWMKDVAKFGESEAAIYMMYSFAGVAAGFFFCGPTAVFLKKKNIMSWESFYVLVGCVETALLVVVAFFNSRAIALLWFFIMLFSTMALIAFSIIRTKFSEEETGRALSLVNCMVFITSFILQWLVGVVIGLFPSDGGSFAPEGYRAAITMYVTLCAAATFWSWWGFKKEKAGN